MNKSFFKTSMMRTTWTCNMSADVQQQFGSYVAFVNAVDAETNTFFKLESPDSCVFVQEYLDSMGIAIPIRYYKGSEVGYYLGSIINLYHMAIIPNDENDLTLIVNEELFGGSDDAMSANIEHELTHVEQIRSGRLMYVNDDIYWEGELFTLTQAQIDYYAEIIQNNDEARITAFQMVALPWEREAYSVMERYGVKPLDFKVNQNILQEIASL